MERNNDGINECTYDELNAASAEARKNNRFNEEVDLSTVNLCKKVRNIARVNNVTVRTDAHSNQNARNLLAYLEYCGVNVDSYVSEYLQNLQPFMIERKAKEEYGYNVICIIDKIYNISLYIKLEKDSRTSKECTVVSFHEDYEYKNGAPLARQNSVLRKNNTDAFVPVFADSIRSVDQNGNAFVDVYVQRGLLTLKVTLNTKLRCQDVYIVRKSDIERALLDYCNTYIEDLYASNLDLDFSQVEIFTMLQQVSFTSYGKDSFSSLSLLVDSFFTQNDQYSKKAADFAIITFAKNLKLNEKDKAELIELLNEKFKITNRKGMSLLMDRIKTYLNDAPSSMPVKTSGIPTEFTELNGAAALPENAPEGEGEDEDEERKPKTDWDGAVCVEILD